MRHTTSARTAPAGRATYTYARTEAVGSTQGAAGCAPREIEAKNIRNNPVKNRVRDFFSFNTRLFFLSSSPERLSPAVFLNSKSTDFSPERGKKRRF